MNGFVQSTSINHHECLTAPVCCRPSQPPHFDWAVARHLDFRAAADELFLTQSAVSRQIQSLEEEMGVPLFLLRARAVELTVAGSQLLRAVLPSLERIDAAVRQIGRSAGRKSVAVATCLARCSLPWPAPGCSKAAGGSQTMAGTQQRASQQHAST